MQNKLESHALYTDHYEFTMLDALVQSTSRKVCFEVFGANFLWEDHLVSLLVLIGSCHI